jgi:hypothetical protein
MQLTLGHSLGVWYCGVTPFSKINSTLTFNNYTIIKNDRQELLSTHTLYLDIQQTHGDVWSASKNR